MTAVRRSGNIHPLPDPADQALPAFDGREVTRATVRITKAGDGLSEALQVQPEALHGGDDVFYVLRGVVRQINHRFGDEDDDPITRQHTIETIGITKIDPKLAEKLLNEAAEKLAQAKAAAAGDATLLDQDDDG